MAFIRENSAEKKIAHGALLEGIIATIIAALLLCVLVREETWVVWLSPAVWINLPVLVLLFRHVPLSEHGFSLASWQAGGRWLFLSIALVLIPFSALLTVWRWITGHESVVALERLTVSTILYHLLYQAVPEELFFRGYLQKRLALWAQARGLTGFGLPICLTALLFAVAHLIVSPSWMRVAVFFPGLVMGWLRERTGGLFAPTGFHWLANLVAVVFAL